MSRKMWSAYVLWIVVAKVISSFPPLVRILEKISSDPYSLLRKFRIRPSIDINLRKFEIRSKRQLKKLWILTTTVITLDIRFWQLLGISKQHSYISSCPSVAELALKKPQTWKKKTWNGFFGFFFFVIFHCKSPCRLPKFDLEYFNALIFQCVKNLFLSLFILIN